MPVRLNRFRTLLSLVALFSMSTLFAQADFGIKAGLRLANAKIKSNGLERDSKVIPTFYFGPVAEFDIGSNLFLQTGLLFGGQGYRYETSSILGATKIKMNAYYLQIPLSLQYDLDKIFLAAGPYYAIGIGGKYSINSDVEAIEWGKETSDNLNRTDFGLNLAIGTEIDMLRVELGYSLGLADIVPTNRQTTDSSIKNNAITAGIQFIF